MNTLFRGRLRSAASLFVRKVNYDFMVETSVIIPTFNRPERLADCLEALAVQDCDDFEVVVVDDGSETPIAPVCEKFAPLVRHVRQENTGPACARNTGAAAARGRFLAFTDDDCRPRQDWLRQLRSAHAGVQGRMVGGLVLNGLAGNRFSSASQFLCDFLYDYFDAAGGHAPFFTSNNLAMDRADFERLGGFDVSFGRAAAEDRDLGLRWRELGGQLVFADQAVVDHYHHLSFGSFWRQHSAYGAGAVHLHRVMKARSVPKPRFESFPFYWRLMTWPIRKQGLRRIDIAVLMVLSQAAMVAGYVEESRSRA